jgi:WG containing repeat
MIDTLGTVVLVPTYKEIKKGSEGFYAVKNEEGKFGFIDKKSKFVIPFEYDEVKFFRKGYCIVSKGKDKWGLINHFNAKTIPTFFKSVVVKETTYELMDEKGDVYIVDDKGECQIQNCAKFEEIRKKANAQ